MEQKISPALFKVEWNSNTDRETLTIRLGAHEYHTELYYYCLDNNFYRDNTSIMKGLLNFVCMIENWKLKIKNLKLSSLAVLPFDYSDEYIGFFIISKIDKDTISIQAAYTTEYLGCMYNPSQFDSINLVDKPYELIDKKYTVSILNFLENVDDSMTIFLSDFYKKD